MADQRPVVGYFAWAKTNRETLSPCKYIKDRRNMERREGLQYQHMPNPIVAEHPLDDAHWALSLDELAKLYPAPGSKPPADPLPADPPPKPSPPPATEAVVASDTDGKFSDFRSE